MNLFTQIQAVERELSLKDPLRRERTIAMIKDFKHAHQSAIGNEAASEQQEAVGSSARWAAAAKAYLLAKRDMDDAKAREAGAKKALQDLCEAAGLDECHGGGILAVKSTHSAMVNYRALAESLLSPEIIREKSEEFARAPTTYWRLTEFKEVLP